MFIVTGYASDGSAIEVFDGATAGDCERWLRDYVRGGDLGGYESFTCNAAPFDGDFEWSWNPDEGFV